MIRAILRFFGNIFLWIVFLFIGLATWSVDFDDWREAKMSKEKDIKLKFRYENPWLWKFMDLILLLAFIGGIITIILSTRIGSWEHGWSILTKHQMLYVCLPIGSTCLLVFGTYTFVSMKARSKERVGE